MAAVACSNPHACMRLNPSASLSWKKIPFSLVDVSQSCQRQCRLPFVWKKEIRAKNERVDLHEHSTFSSSSKKATFSKLVKMTATVIITRAKSLHCSSWNETRAAQRCHLSLDVKQEKNAYLIKKETRVCSRSHKQTSRDVKNEKWTPIVRCAKMVICKVFFITVQIMVF